MSIISCIAFLYCFLHYIIFHIVKPNTKEMDSKEDQLIDDEIFFGKLSLKEIKLMFAPNQTQRQTIVASELAEDDCNMSLQLISTQSEPDINKGKGILNSPESITKALSNVTLSPNGPQLNDNFELTSSDNSFLKDDKLTEESCETASKECLDNTLEAIEKILNSAPKESPQNVAVNFHFASNGQVKEYKISPSKVNNAYTNQQSTEKCLKSVSSPAFTPVKQERNIKEVFATPSSVLRSKPSQLKTPVNVQLFKKPSTSSIKKTPSKNDAFKHIASPVAYYIKNSPQVPLVQNVKPRKHLTGTSSIPKLVKSSAVKSANKENVNLPSVAYKSAKKTTVIDVSNGPRLPQSQWARKLTDSLPRPAVIKHSHREKDFLYKKSFGRRQEDSFGDLSVHQADVSVCTKKSAY